MAHYLAKGRACRAALQIALETTPSGQTRSAGACFRLSQKTTSNRSPNINVSLYRKRHAPSSRSAIAFDRLRTVRDSLARSMGGGLLGARMWVGAVHRAVWLAITTVTRSRRRSHRAISLCGRLGHVCVFGRCAGPPAKLALGRCRLAWSRGNQHVHGELSGCSEAHRTMTQANQSVEPTAARQVTVIGCVGRTVAAVAHLCRSARVA